MTNADTVVDELFQEKVKLALFHRIAKDVLKYKNPMSVKDAVGDNGFFRFIFKFDPHSIFLKKYVDGNYKLIPDIQINSLLSHTNIGNNNYLSLNEYDDLLNTPYIDAQTLLQVQIQNFLSTIEEIIIIDNNFYRILSLSAVFNPELFSKEFLKVHFDFLCSFYKVKSLTFANIGNIFCTILLDKQIIYKWFRQVNKLFIYNIISVGDDYIIYVNENLISVDSGDIKITRMTFKDFIESKPSKEYQDFQIVSMKKIIVGNLIEFYGFSTSLQDKYKESKKTSFENMQILGNLQEQSYYLFLLDIKLLLSSN
jgi:hypothetical protein